ncbi:MAG TPA: hypothetical protein VNU94_02835 [Acidobacteriaceae bacterium]|nr:hypothetical protein [Acidobacteriaceae bacterium]
MHIRLHFTKTTLLAAALLAASLPASAQSTDAAPAPAAAAPASSQPSNQDIQQTLEQLKQLIQQQSQQLQQQQQEINALESKHPVQPPPGTPVPAPGATAQSSSSTQPPAAVSAAVTGGAIVQQEPSGTPYHQFEEASPLFLKLGSATFTPGGWIDFTSIYRTTDVGSGFTTALATIPFNNTAQGGLSENRLTAANSRLSLRVDEAFGKTKVYGYGEIDFNGTAPGNVYVSTNSDVTRLRVFYLNLSAGKWDVLGGQSWSLLTPNRSGLSPFLSEIYNTVHLDTAYNAGIVYARQAQLRVVYHFTPNLALGLSAENPEQFSGAAVTFPAAFNTAETDLNSSSGSNTVANLHPDVIAKIAYDHKFGTRNWHVEAAGLLTPVAIATTPTSSKPSVEDRREGGGVAVNTNLEVAKGLHLIADSFWSDGGGRYIGGLGPQFVVAQFGSTNAPLTAELVHAGAGLGGFEYQATKSTLVSLIYGGAYFDRVFSVDPSNSHLVGYGFTGSANTNNRFIQEGTFATVTSLFKKPSYGAVQLITQFSYIERTPWYVAPGAPRNAHLLENYFDIRYVLP